MKTYIAIKTFVQGASLMLLLKFFRIIGGGDDVGTRTKKGRDLLSRAWTLVAAFYSRQSTRTK